MAAEFLQRMGERMRERREELGLSRPDVARAMPGKVSENQIYRWEIGKHQPNPDTLEALARVLKTDVAYFMAPPPESVGPTPEPFLNGNGPGFEEQVLARLEVIEDLIRAATAANAARVAEALQLLEDRLPPNAASQQRRPA